MTMTVSQVKNYAKQVEHDDVDSAHVLNVLPVPLPYLRAAPIYARLHNLQDTIEDRL